MTRFRLLTYTNACTSKTTNNSRREEPLTYSMSYCIVGLRDVFCMLRAVRSWVISIRVVFYFDGHPLKPFITKNHNLSENVKERDHFVKIFVFAKMLVFPEFSRQDVFDRGIFESHPEIFFLFFQKLNCFRENRKSLVISQTFSRKSKC